MVESDHFTLRSITQRCVSKGGNEHLVCCPPFETAVESTPKHEGRPPQDDEVLDRGSAAGVTLP
jgi:hypothetical protein